jgi:hypothetical protein
MHPRNYVVGLVVVAFAAFLSVTAANLIIDPEGVFHTGLFGQPNPNDRYLRFVDYASASDKYDGLLFGSSRSGAISLEDLSLRMKGATFARFTVAYGSIIDFLPMLEFALRNEDKKGRRLRSVFLLLDAESFGQRAPSENAIQQLLPPALSGRSAFNFWWTNLTAIQFKAWENSVTRAWSKQPVTAPMVIGGWNGFRAVLAALPSVEQAHAQAAPSAQVDPSIVAQRRRVGDDFLHQLRLLERFVSLCREHGVDLVVAASPVSRAGAVRFDSDDLVSAVDAISRIVPVWDFTRSDWLTDRPDMWPNEIHFNPEIARMMLSRIFGDELPVGWKDYGQLKKAEQSSSR